MMYFRQINIGPESWSFFQENKHADFQKINQLLTEQCGILGFFEEENDYIQLKQEVDFMSFVACDSRIEYGDFQTNQKLSLSITHRLADKGAKPHILIEPTCGKGSFILSAIKTFDSLKQVFGIEIQEDYLWELKFGLLEYFLAHPAANRPKIHLYHHNVFDFDFKQIKDQIKGQEILVIGNPPWVTNSTLSALNSKNLPHKSNFKKIKGLDAITGKSNFDIGEFISLKMFDLFSDENGYFSFLIKNSVIKNILHDQLQNKFPISNLEKHIIDTQREFGASVDAGLFVCKFNSVSEFTADEYDFYTSTPRVTLGWVNNKFASDIEKYKQYKQFDGVCPYEWRQGIKHDCAKVMELERIEGGFRNALGEEFFLEEDLIYGLLKSSDLKGREVNTSRKYTIVTQKKVGEDTAKNLENLPKTRDYLEHHQDHFLKRKSSIYKGKPPYSIFGIGDYSFKPYKVAISGLYKQTRFTLVKPGLDEKILLLDDTCYFIGFDTLNKAQSVLAFLNSDKIQTFIQSFMFTDAKRVITKELLMRIKIEM